ncbi:MAG: sulfate adenylyltransferase [Candidatus Ratteibacteria bacterium]
MEEIIKPHGGKLINCVLNDDEKKEFIEKVSYLKKIYLNEREVSDLYMISIGAFSPLDGFLNKDDYINVVENMRLKNGIVWPIPITLSIDDEERKILKEGEEIVLSSPENIHLGIMKIDEVYSYDKKKEARYVYKTEDENHPGVSYVYSNGDYLIGGKVYMLNEPFHEEFKDYWFKPVETREIFKNKGWKKIVGFQTRNPIHRAHEFIIKTALEIVDGVFINPLVGQTKKDDVPADIRMKCYKVLIDKYFPKERVFIGVYGGYMRYAGPREAVLHAIVRKNFGCTHFIVGRDHAGVGNYYGPFDAQKIFYEFKKEDIEIEILFFENAFYCKKCGEMRTVKTCPHNKEDWLSFSGSKIRELFAAGEIPPSEFTRPEIANILMEWYLRSKNG